MANKRVHNFNAGPAALPLPALEEAQRELVDFEGTGMSLLEHSHRDAPYEKVHREAISLLKSFLAIPDTHEVLLMQGGARAQFAIVPMNLLHAGSRAGYVVTGTWAKGAYEEAKLVGDARQLVSTEADKRFTRVPTASELGAIDPGLAYVHITSNNTLFGTQWSAYPEVGDVPLVVDATSDAGTRPVDWTKVAVLYAGAQKNLGPAGVTLVVVRKDLIDRGRKDVPTIFQYRSFASSESLYNTPPTFSIYVMRNTLRWLVERGGLTKSSEETKEKARRVYEVVDARADVFRCPVERASRSDVNVVFRMRSEDEEKRFLAEAQRRALVGLKGHRSVGGMRASLYAAVSLESVDALTALMREWQ